MWRLLILLLLLACTPKSQYPEPRIHQYEQYIGARYGIIADWLVTTEIHHWNTHWSNWQITWRSMDRVEYWYRYIAYSNQKAQAHYVLEHVFKLY